VSGPASLSLIEVAGAIARRELSSREVTQACLDRIAKLDPQLNAFMSLEAESALSAADQADAELARGRRRGPLHGVPLAHKDMYYDAGKVVTCGSKIRRDFVAPTTATALARLYQAGTIRLGTLQMSEFAYGPTGHNAHYGAVRNPWNPDHVTGGSSSGSGAAVAARLTFAALGSDTGGSIRMPANFCGVTGLKTTVGLVSRHGAMPLSQSLDTVGPLARTAADCAIITQLIAGGDPLDPTTRAGAAPDYTAALTAPLKGRRIGVPDAFYVDDLDAEVARALDDMLALLKREGAEIVTVKLPLQPRLTAACQLLLAVEAAAFHAQWMRERPGDYGPQVLMRLQNGLAVPGVTYLETLRWRAVALAEHLEAVAGVDAWIAPVSPRPTPTIAGSDVGGGVGAEAVIQAITRFTRPINYLGLPALALPAGRTASGLPIGLQLVGRPFAEDVVLGIGCAVQRASDIHTARPPLS
jgi:aspartyl-tRNA(Asn)/glutamyl-tRNA(Gln) amidotransferase subunit A